MGGLEPLAEGLGGVGGAEALDRIAEEGLLCRLWHDGLRGASFGSVGVRVRTSSKVCSMCTPSCLPAPPAHFTQRRSSYKVGADHEARCAGAWGGEGSMPGVLERGGGGRGPAVLAGLAVPGGAGAAVAGAGGGGWVRVEGGTGGGGGHGAAVARLVASGGAGVVAAGTGGGGWVWAAGGTGSPAGPVGGGGGGRGAAVACLAASGGAGAVVAGAGGGGLVWPEGGGGGGHGAAVALVVAPGGAGAAGAGSLRVVVAPGGAGAARVGG